MDGGLHVFMAWRSMARAGRLTGVLAMLSVSAVLGCRGASAPAAGMALRTADGHPDLRGVWNFSAVTPMERPDALKDKAEFTDEEAAGFQRPTVVGVGKEGAVSLDADRRSTDPNTDLGPGYNQFWYENVSKSLTTKRTSLIVDPPDGRIPPLTEEAQRREAEAAKGRNRLPGGPEEMPLQARCILGLNSGPPMYPSYYNNNVLLAQTRDEVVIVNEMNHNSRIVPLNGRPHDTIRQWVGDSRGRWEGDTLVIDTINFKGPTNFPGSTANLHLVETFKRVGPDTLLYTFTAEDPTTWTRPWTAEIPMTRSAEPVYEYACHEGNYAMSGILGGARIEEREGKKSN